MNLVPKIDDHPDAPKMSFEPELGTSYAFNINPDDAHQYFDKTPKSTLERIENDRLKRFVQAFTRLLQEFTLNEILFHMKVEASFPCKETSTNFRSRLHFHGYIKFPTVHSLRWFYLYGTVILDKVARTIIKPIGDPEGWHKYIHKQDFLKWPEITQFGGEGEFYKNDPSDEPDSLPCKVRVRKPASKRIIKLENDLRNNVILNVNDYKIETKVSKKKNVQKSETKL